LIDVCDLYAMQTHQSTGFKSDKFGCHAPRLIKPSLHMLNVYAKSIVSTIASCKVWVYKFISRGAWQPNLPDLGNYY